MSILSLSLINAFILTHLALPLKPSLYAASCGTLEQKIPPCAYRALNAFYDEDPNTFQLLEKCIQEYPDNPFPAFTFALVQFRYGEYYTTIPDKTLDDRIEAMKILVNSLSQSHPKEPFTLMAQASYYGLVSLFEIERGHKIPAARAAKQMQKFIRAIETDYPHCPWTWYFRGTFDYFADQVPRFYKIFSFFLGVPRGNRERGLRLLEEAAAQPSMVQIEAIRTLVYIDLFFEKNYLHASKWTRKLIRLHPKNLTHRLFALRSALHSRQWLLADRAWRDWLVRAIINQVPLPQKTSTETFFWRARWWLHMENYSMTETWLQHILDTKLEKPDWLDPWCLFSLAQVYDATGKTVEAYKIYNTLLRGPDYRGFHSLIKRRLTKGIHLTPDSSNY